ncbi:glycosyltransferase family 4 protein [Neptunicella marina]|uniref:Glycosyltransferase family 4 protein n=1 Tax=Neptunicella marina TaxID=2125989 RepID=A0A8J6ITW7_9ALTE|nr:glycosyltransferase family 4 protein [Neptunicella marina]MBC3765765.1 glycosyltransferase family 4 protein [Neptunicella marina]
MNIGIVTTWFDRGAAFVSKQYADILSKENSIFIFARGGEKYDKTSAHWQTYPVLWGKIYKESETRVNWNEFKKWIIENNIDLVIFNEQKDWEIIVDAKKLNIKTVAYIDYYTQETVPFFSLYDGLICNTKRHFSVFNWHPGAIYIPWGTDIEKFQNPHRVDNFKTPKFFHSAGMGGIRYRKGTDLLVKAFNQLEDKAELIIHSQVPLSYYSEIEHLVKSNPNISFIEKSVPPPGLYYLGNIYVYPSKLDGIGLTICESLAMGLPVITTNCAPMNEFVSHKRNGLLVDVEKYVARPDGYYWPESICSITDLKNAMQFMVTNFHKIQEFSDFSIENAHQNFNWESNATKLLTIINRIERIDVKHDIQAKALGYTFSTREKVYSRSQALIRKIRRKLFQY